MLLSGALIALLSALAVAMAWSVGWGTLWEGTWEAFGSPETLREYVLGFGAWAPVVFFLAQVARWS